MKKVSSNSVASFAFFTVLLAVQTVWGAGTTTWSGAGGNQNWSTAGNWTTIGGTTPPGTTDAVVFDTAGAAATAGTINNIVDSSLTIGSLVFSNGTATAFHGTQISGANTLRVNGPIMIGMTNNSSTYTITGGSLVSGSGSSTFTNSSINGGTMTLDMSGLNNFVHNFGGSGGIFWLGVDVGGSAAGVMKLAALSNSITATTMAIGQNNFGGTSSLNLGAGTNILNVNSLQLGYDKANGTLQFNSTTGGLLLRNAAGTGSATVTVCGDVHSGGSSSSGVGSILLNGHYVDMSIGLLTVGNRAARTASAAGGANNTGTFSFNTGIVNVSAINMATNAVGGTNVSGTVSVGGGTMKVANNISLVYDNGGSTNSGTLIITNGGLLSCGGNIVKSTAVGKGTISITNATLTLSSPAGSIGLNQAIDVINLSNATIHLKLDNNNQVTSINATTINTNGTNPIIIDSVANASGAMTFTLITYTGTDPFGSLSLTLPLGYTGNLIDGAGTIQVSITAPPAAPLTWYGATNSVLVSNWDTNKTQNWLDASLAPQSYGNPDPVTFDDTAATNLVNVITTNTPNSVTFNNNSLNYVFSGNGKISGTTSLIKNGTASLLLGDNGDDFSGGIVVNGGTVVLDNTNGTISGGLTIYGTAQIGNNDNYGALPTGPLDDEGTLVFQRANNLTASTSIAGGGGLTQNGNGTLTLTASNNYTGLTTISKGTLALSGAGTVSNSYSVTVNHAAFDVTAIGGTTLVQDFNLTEATLNLSTTNLHTPLLVNSFEADGILAQSNIINITTLPAVAVYPATIPLVRSANPITLTGGNFNFILGSPLPQGSAGSLSESADQKTLQLTLASGPINQRNSVTWAGLDTITATTNWSDSLNWQLPGVPGAADNVIFDGSTTVAAGTVNNYVDQNFTVATLTFDQTVNNQWHVTQIPAGTILAVSGATTVGGVTGDGLKTFVAMVDAGTLLLNNNLTIGDNGAGSADTGTILDLSGLTNFVVNASSGTITMGSGNRSAANFSLASGSNSITAATLNANIASSSTSDSGNLTLGAGTNNLNVGTINVAAQRSSCTVQFPASSTTGGLRLRGTAGTDTSRTTMTVGNRTASGSSGTTTGTLSLNGHQVDMKTSTLTVGECTATTPNIGSGVLQFDTGVIDSSTLQIAVNTGTGTANGSVTVGPGATLVVGSGGISLVNQSSTGAGSGSFTLNGGTVICSNSILKTTTTGSTANISLTGGTLNLISGVIGATAAQIDSLTLNGGTTIQLSVIAGATNIVASAVSASGTTTINIASFGGLTGPVQLPLLYYGSGDPFSSLQLGTVPAGYTVSALIDDTANQTIDIMVTPPAPIVWVGAVGSALNSTWNTSTPNWLNGSMPTTYADVDYVQFDDTASNFVVTLPATVSPAGLSVNNGANNYVFNGAGFISGLTGLAKQGSSTLTLDNGGLNNFTGPVTITAGTLQVGNNDANGNIPAATAISDSGTLAFGRTDSNTIPNQISGSGGVTQLGAGTNRLTAANTYNGDTLITSGMIIATNATGGNSSIGSISGNAIITNGGTLDIENPVANIMSFTNTADNGGKQFLIAGTGVGGNGAIVNNGTQNQQNVIQNLALTANAAIGGPARWDLRVPDGHFQPILDLRGFTLTKISTNQMSLVSVIVTNGGSIVISNGIFSFEVVSSNSSTPITVEPGAVLGHFRENAGHFTAPITLNGGSIRDLNGTPGSTNDSPITLTANSFLDLNVGSTDQLRLNGDIAESGGSYGLTKTNVGSFSLAGVNTYSGPTLVVQGTLILANNGSIAQSKVINVSSGTTFDASQRADQTLTLNAGQTLSGFGTVTGIVAAVSGSTVAPGSASSVGILTFDNNVTLGGTNTMKVSRVSTATNDVLNVVSPATLTLGGTLTVTSLGGTFVAGDSFKLFNAPGGLSGVFSATNLPALGGGLGWVTTNLVNGILTVVNAVNTNPTNVTATVSGNLLTLTWPADHTGWRLQVQTNSVGSGLNPNPGAWSAVPGSASVNTENITTDPSQGTVFYRLVYP